MKNNLLRDCTFTVEDIDRSVCIFGDFEPLLYGRITAPVPSKHREMTYNVPEEFKKIHNKVKLYIDLCYINKMCFLVTVSETMNYVTCNSLDNKSKKTLANSIKCILKLYVSRGFTVSDIFSDNEFDFDEIRTKTLPAKLSICAAGEHVPKIERTIRTIKERTRIFCHSISYTKIPGIMLKALISSSIQ